MSYDSFDLILVQTLKKTLMDGQGGAFAGPAKHERVRCWVRRHCKPGHWNICLRGKLADFGLKPAVFARSKIAETACESDNHWTYQRLEYDDEKCPYKAKC